MNSIENSKEPLIFNDLINDWKILNWSLNDWDSKLNDDEWFTFRTNNFIKSKEPLWENTCKSQSMKMKDFIKFQNNDDNTNWVYFDYKPMDTFFDTYNEILESIQWKKFGFPDKSGKDTTIWMGSKGAHTPCHKDTYGYNLIAQIYGRKRWIIFPPDENLFPTRIPFEESSIYSKLNFFYPDLNAFKGIGNARTVILNPGDVLYLPAGWWHYVENLETAISVNMWIKMPQDNRRRVEEGMVQLFISNLLKESDKKTQDSILNPLQEFVLENNAKDYLQMIEINLERCKQNKKFKKTATVNTEIKKENIKKIPKLSEEDFVSLLNEQRTKYNFVEEKEEERSKNKNEFMEKIINAICDPEIITQIVDKIVRD